MEQIETMRKQLLDKLAAEPGPESDFAITLVNSVCDAAVAVRRDLDEVLAYVRGQKVS